MRAQQKSYKKAVKKDKKSLIEIREFEKENNIKNLEKLLIIKIDKLQNLKKHLLKIGFKQINDYSGFYINTLHSNYVIFKNYASQLVKAKIYDKEEDVEIDYYDLIGKYNINADFNNININNIKLENLSLNFNKQKRANIISEIKSSIVYFYFLCTCKDLNALEYNVIVDTLLNNYNNKEMNFALFYNDILPLKYRKKFIMYFFQYKNYWDIFNDLPSELKKLFFEDPYCLRMIEDSIENPTYAEKKLMFKTCIKNEDYSKLTALVNKFGSINSEIDRIVIQYKLGFYN